MRRHTLLFVALVAVAALVALPSSAHKGRDLPKTIALPTGFQPEGIAIHGKTFFVGSIPTGAIYSGSVRTGAGDILVPGVSGRSAIGVEYDRRHDRLFVAGGGTGKAFVYDADDGSLIKEYQLTTLSPRFINDVVVTRTGAFFTDSNNQQLYKVSIGPGGSLAAASETIPLTGELSYSAGFNLNGIDAAKNGKWLVVVQSNEGKLFRVNPRTGVTREFALTGGDVMTGDGILLQGKRLFVVQNTRNQIAVIRVDRRLTEGAIKRLIKDPLFDVPTTIDDVGHNTLYAVNARFGVPPADRPTATYNLVRVDVGKHEDKKNDRSGSNRGRVLNVSWIRALSGGPEAASRDPRPAEEADVSELVVLAVGHDHEADGDRVDLLAWESRARNALQPVVPAPIGFAEPAAGPDFDGKAADQPDRLPLLGRPTVATIAAASDDARTEGQDGDDPRRVQHGLLRLQLGLTYGGDLVSTWSVLRLSCKPRSPVGLVKQPGTKRKCGY